jgi:hypothetical protein
VSNRWKLCWLGAILQRLPGIVHTIPSRLGVGMAARRTRCADLGHGWIPFKAQLIANLCAGDARGLDGSPIVGRSTRELRNVSDRSMLQFTFLSVQLRLVGLLASAPKLVYNGAHSHDIPEFWHHISYCLRKLLQQGVFFAGPTSSSQAFVARRSSLMLRPARAPAFFQCRTHAAPPGAK